MAWRKIDSPTQFGRQFMHPWSTLIERTIANEQEKQKITALGSKKKQPNTTKSKPLAIQHRVHISSVIFAVA